MEQYLCVQRLVNISWPRSGFPDSAENEAGGWRLEAGAPDSKNVMPLALCACLSEMQDATHWRKRLQNLSRGTYVEMLGHT